MEAALGGEERPNLGTIGPKLGIMSTMPRSVPSKRSAPTKRGPERVGLADALFSGTQQRVLALVFGQPDRSFYANEVIAHARAGRGAVHRELKRLADSELVTVQISGNQKHYQANPASPIFDELCGIVRKTMGLAEPLRKALEPLAKRIKAAFVYGSVAKKGDSASSDIDLMIVSSDLTYADLYEALEAVSQQLGRKVNPTIFAPSELAKRVASGGAFVKRVLEQPKVWLKGDERALGL
ncbi:MAG TPA: nucleotidyltransferase domain-containing protein [Burkholderiaceae bacterium]|nr:nucleotidyltransferase domain-containing protein [Burkholderiaceae bacterium]